MQITDKFSLNPIDELHSALLFENKKTTTVCGKVIERQFQIQDNYLLLLTEDKPYEEALYIYYLNHNLEVIDFAEISQIYTGGILDDVKTNTDTLTFTFFDKTDNWEIKILPQPKRNFSINFTQVLKRPFSFGKLKYLDIRQIGN